MAVSLVSPQLHNYFFINLLYQPYIAMANRLIRIEDVASIAFTSADQLTERAPSPAGTEPDITDPHRTPLPVSQDDDEEVPGLAPAPGAPLSPRTAAMVLEAAGKTDGDMLVKNAKDFAATIRQLKKRMDETQDRALEAEGRLEELLSNKENEPPACNHSNHRNRSSSTATYDQPEYEGVCPVGFEENTGQATGFYIPDDDGNQQEPKFVRFVQGANPHAEGTRGQGFPIFLHHLYAPADYEETDLPLAQLPIWFTAALSRHSSMYNVVLRAALEHNNWGICADLIRYRQAEDQIGIWEARVEEASQRVERAREERVQTRYRLEAARAHRHFANLERTNKPEDWQYDDDPGMVLPLRQLARRGRRQFRGRGRPQD
jgi:hypothetical protein